ncbi:MAG: helix-turn-helix transcriptional regulator [bacterium]|nr:helix-turn-helix transcriptional regulator [bacterium]
MSISRCCPQAKVVELDLAAEAGLFRALADPHRLAILATLGRAEGEVCVCDFTAGLPLYQPRVSHHLRLLREAGLVTCERRGTWVYYALAPEARGRLAAALNLTLPETVRA